jgi:probable phosphoglycerate mutase
MKKTVLFLTRHGQTEWNLQKRMQGHQNSALTTLGEQQAEWLRERLEGENLGAIYSSISPRALHTAQILR